MQNHSPVRATVRDYSHADRITLTGVECLGYHGVLDSEKQTGQPFIVDVTLFTDFVQAVAADDVLKTVNYAEVAETIRTVISSKSLDLIETLADRLATAILDQFPLLALELTVHKPKAPLDVTFTDVSVTIFRESHVC